MRILLVPMDERPVTTHLPRMVAALAGAEVLLPPAKALPKMRQAADIEALTEWLDTTSPTVDALVVSLDMLGYGGLLHSRIGTEPAEQIIDRTSVLARIRRSQPLLPIHGMSAVLRASRSHSAAEEPTYWADFGVELHDVGADFHRRFLGEPSCGPAPGDLPPSVVDDFVSRRLRNHTLDLYALGLVARRVLSTLTISADDTAVRSAGSLEQTWLAHWSASLTVPDRVRSYPGADEVGAVLVARALTEGAIRQPRVALSFPDAESAQRVAAYENLPVGISARRHLSAAGATVVPLADRPDAVLVVHGPEPAGRDWCGIPVPDDVGAHTARTARQVMDLLDRDVPVGVADVRFTNGGDPALVEELRAAGILGKLCGYGGWNTAGNSIGTVAATLVAWLAGLQAGTADPRARDRLLWHRVIEDCCYQAEVRTQLLPRFRDNVGFPFADPGAERSYLDACEPLLDLAADRVGATAAGWHRDQILLPWHRTFEIDFTLTEGR